MQRPCNVGVTGRPASLGRLGDSTLPARWPSESPFGKGLLASNGDATRLHPVRSAFRKEILARLGLPWPTV